MDQILSFAPTSSRLHSSQLNSFCSLVETPLDKALVLARSLEKWTEELLVLESEPLTIGTRERLRVLRSSIDSYEFCLEEGGPLPTDSWISEANYRTLGTHLENLRMDCVTMKHHRDNMTNLYRNEKCAATREWMDQANRQLRSKRRELARLTAAV